MTKSIGQIHCEASTAKMVELGIPLDTIWTWDEMKPGEGQEPIESGAKAAALHVLDLMAAAGVTPAEAATQIRAGRTIEEVCSDPLLKIGAVHGCRICEAWAPAKGENTWVHPPSPCELYSPTGSLGRGYVRPFVDERSTPEQEAERRQELKQAFLDSAPESEDVSR